VVHAEGVLDSKICCFVYEGEDRVALLILHRYAEARVPEPVLVLVAGVGRDKDKGAITDGEAAPLVGLAEDLEGGLVHAADTITGRRVHLHAPAMATFMVVASFFPMKCGCILLLGSPFLGGGVPFLRGYETKAGPNHF
jgi:hypothetical protein